MKERSTFVLDPRVAVVRESPSYSPEPPYAPSDGMPEWESVELGEHDNPAYRGVRKLFLSLGLDSANCSTPLWNPLGALIHPGYTVVVKPNLVFHKNEVRGYDAKSGFECMVTHGSVVRAVCDYVAKAMGGAGRIIIADCPIQGAHWPAIIQAVGLDSIVNTLLERWPNLEIVVSDNRLVHAILRNGKLLSTQTTARCESEYEEVDLGKDSLLVPLMQQGDFSFGVTDYSKHRMIKAHSPQRNVYLFHKDVLNADVLVNLPKLKTHMKAGYTCALKNLVGLIGHKDYLPHFRFGSPKDGGDEYPDGNFVYDLMWAAVHRSWETEQPLAKRTYQILARLFSAALRLQTDSDLRPWALGGGGWAGNDTIWRTVLDINRALFYYDRSIGRVSSHPENAIQHFTIVDGLIAGQANGPLSPKPIPAGVMLAGFNPLAVDTVAASMMGFDVDKIKVVKQGFDIHSMPLASFRQEDVLIVGDLVSGSVRELLENGEFNRFEPASGFRGQIEYAS